MSALASLPEEDGAALPRGWSRATLGDLLLDIEAGRSFKCDERPPHPDEIGVVKISAVTWGEYDESESKTCREPSRFDPSLLIAAGDFLFSRANTIALVGACVIARRVSLPVMLSDKILRLRFAHVLPEWVLYALRTPAGRGEIERLATGNQESMRNIAQGNIRRIRIPIAPVAEQRRIVAAIDAQFSRLDAAVAALRRVQANLARYRAAVLKAACEGRLVPTEAELTTRDGRAYEPAGALLEQILIRRNDQSDSIQITGRQRKIGPNVRTLRHRDAAVVAGYVRPDLPAGWTWSTLDQLCSLFTDCPHRTPVYAEEGYPALRPRDVAGGRLNVSDAAKVSATEFTRQTEKHRPEAGDIIYSRELSYGWAVIVPTGVTLCMSQGMVLFRPHPEVLTEYLLMVLNGPLGRAQADKAATGSAHPHINLADIRAYALPLAPLAEQRRIVAEVERRLSVVQAVEETTAASLKRAEALRQAILRRAFEGELVPQDPNDEPASELLERIRASQNGAVAPRRGAKGRRSLMPPLAL